MEEDYYDIIEEYEEPVEEYEEPVEEYYNSNQYENYNYSANNNDDYGNENYYADYDYDYDYDDDEESYFNYDREDEKFKKIVDRCRKNIELMNYDISLISEKLLSEHPRECVKAVERIISLSEVQEISSEEEKLFWDTIEESPIIVDSISNFYELIFGKNSYNKEIYLDIAKDVTKEQWDCFNILSSGIKIKYEEQSLELVREDPQRYFRYLPQEIMLKNPEICLEVVKNTNMLFKYLPQELMLENSEFCLEIVRNNLKYSDYLPKELMIENSKACLDIAKENEEFFYYLPKEVIIDEIKSMNYDVSLIPEHLLEKEPYYCLELVKEIVSFSEKKKLLLMK